MLEFTDHDGFTYAVGLYSRKLFSTLDFWRVHILGSIQHALSGFTSLFFTSLDLDGLSLHLSGDFTLAPSTDDFSLQSVHPRTYAVMVSLNGRRMPSSRWQF